MAGIRRTRVNPLGSILLGGNQPTLATSGRFWTPASMTTALWLDAADSATLTLSGSAVTQWNDKSGNGRNVAQGTAGVQPFVTAGALAGRQVVEFAGDYLTSSSAASTWAFLHNSFRSSVTAVVKFGTGSNPATFYGLVGTSATSSSAVGTSIYYSDESGNNDAMVDNVSRGVGGAFAVTATNGNSLTPNTALLVTVENDPVIETAASRARLTVNGTAQTQTNAVTNGASSANPTYALQVGATGNNVGPLTGYIAELVITSGSISPENKQRLEGYLAHKWALTANLPATHPYKVYAPVL
jgi:hypothetical protein